MQTHLLSCNGACAPAGAEPAFSSSWPARQQLLAKMFGKILRAGKGSHGLKYKIDVHVQQLEGLPSHIKRARVVWSRSAKMQMTKVKDVRGSRYLQCGRCASVRSAVLDPYPPARLFVSPNRRRHLQGDANASNYHLSG